MKELKGFTKLVDKTPVLIFAREFEKELMRAAVERYGEIIPPSRKLMRQLALEVIERMKP